MHLLGELIIGTYRPPPSAAGVHSEPLTIGLTDCSTPSSTPCFVHQNSLLAPTEDDPVCLYHSFTDVIGSVACSRGRESTDVWELFKVTQE